MENESRQPQLYDTLSKKGVFYRIVDVTGDILKAKRIKGDTNAREGRPVVGTWDEIQARGYRFCDIAPVEVSYLPKEETEEQEEELAAEEAAQEPEETEETQEEQEQSEEVQPQPMNTTAVMITGMICLTIIVLSLINKE
jgi:hypothetical protein